MDDKRPDMPKDVRLHEDFLNAGVSEGTCPECGAELGTSGERAKHAVAHYGDTPLPVTPGTRLARQRQAFLMGETIPER